MSPVCTIARLAGAFFPPGDFGKLSGLDRNRIAQPVTRKSVSTLFNEILKAQLDGVVTIKRPPQHGDEDLCGYTGPRDAIKRVFRDCESPDTAVSAFVVSGPNGVGKTFNVEGHAADSGRIIIGLRQM